VNAKCTITREKIEKKIPREKEAHLRESVGQSGGGVEAVPGNEQRQHGRDADVGDQADDQRRDDGDRHVLGRVARLLARHRDDVEPDERVETRRRPGHHLQRFQN